MSQFPHQLSKPPKPYCFSIKSFTDSKTCGGQKEEQQQVKQKTKEAMKSSSDDPLAASQQQLEQFYPTNTCIPITSPGSSSSSKPTWMSSMLPPDVEGLMNGPYGPGDELSLFFPLVPVLSFELSVSARNVTCPGTLTPFGACIPKFTGQWDLTLKWFPTKDCSGSDFQQKHLTQPLQQINHLQIAYPSPHCFDTSGDTCEDVQIAPAPAEGIDSMLLSLGPSTQVHGCSLPSAFPNPNPNRNPESTGFLFGSLWLTILLPLSLFVACGALIATAAFCFLRFRRQQRQQCGLKKQNKAVKKTAAATPTAGATSPTVTHVQFLQEADDVDDELFHPFGLI